MKITVLGCGALGQLWLTTLCKHGHEVSGVATRTATLLQR